MLIGVNHLPVTLRDRLPYIAIWGVWLGGNTLLALKVNTLGNRGLLSLPSTGIGVVYL